MWIGFPFTVGYHLICKIFPFLYISINSFLLHVSSKHSLSKFGARNSSPHVFARLRKFYKILIPHEPSLYNPTFLLLLSGTLFLSLI